MHWTKRLKVERGLTQSDIAEALGVAQSAVSNWSRGEKEPSAERAVDIETKLGVPRSEIRPDLWPVVAEPQPAT